ncbi:MAG: DUF4097 family beta strand repeat-containing protein [Lachnospiraceae bacterium]
MKKGWKIFAIVCSSMAGVGLILCIAGFTMGVTREDFGIYRNQEEFYYDDPEEGQEYVMASKEFDNVKSLDVDVQWVSLSIEQYDGAKIKVESDMEEPFQSYIEENELHIATSKGHRDNLERSITIYVPRTMELQEASIQVGKGELFIDGIKANDLELTVGAGRAEVSQFQSNQFSITVGAGEADVTGSVASEVDGECGVGTLNLTLSGTKQEYNYEIECGLGEIRIEEEEYSGISDKKVNNQGMKNIDLTCGLGTVSVDFDTQQK